MKFKVKHGELNFEWLKWLEIIFKKLKTESLSLKICLFFSVLFISQ